MPSFPLDSLIIARRLAWPSILATVVFFLLNFPWACPFFLPSAIVAPYSARIEHGSDVRGSLPFWTSGKICQWLASGGRTWKDLSRAEQKAFLLDNPKRWNETLSLSSPPLFSLV